MSKPIAQSEKPPTDREKQRQVEAMQRRLLHLHARLASLGYTLTYTVTPAGGGDILPPPPPAPTLAAAPTPDPDEPPVE